jgi:hypothetical protein
MLKRINPQFINDISPEHRDEARAIWELTEQLFDLLDAKLLTPESQAYSQRQGPAFLELNALINVYSNAALGLGVEIQASQQLMRTAIALQEMAAAHGRQAQPAANSGALH